MKPICALSVCSMCSINYLVHVSLLDPPLGSLQSFLGSPQHWDVDWEYPEVPAVAPQWRTERSLFAAVTQHSGIELRLKAAELSAPSACTYINSTHYKEHTGPDRPPVHFSFYCHWKSRSLAVHSILLHLFSLLLSAVLMVFRSIRFHRCKPQTTYFVVCICKHMVYIWWLRLFSTTINWN